MNLCFLSVLLKKKILPKRLHLQCFHCLIHCTDRWFCFCKRTYHYELKISGKQQLNRCQSDGSWIRPLQFVTAKNGHKIPVADLNGETCPERDGEPVKDTDSPFLLHPLLWLLMNLLPWVALMKSLKSLHWFQLHHLLPCLLMSLFGRFWTSSRLTSTRDTLSAAVSSVPCLWASSRYISPGWWWFEWKVHQRCLLHSLLWVSVLNLLQEEYLSIPSLEAESPMAPDSSRWIPCQHIRPGCWSKPQTVLRLLLHHLTATPCCCTSCHLHCPGWFDHLPDWTGRATCTYTNTRLSTTVRVSPCCTPSH